MVTEIEIRVRTKLELAGKLLKDLSLRYDPDQPREPNGEFGSGGSAGESESDSGKVEEKESSEPEHEEEEKPTLSAHEQAFVDSHDPAAQESHFSDSVVESGALTQAEKDKSEALSDATTSFDPGDISTYSAAHGFTEPERDALSEKADVVENFDPSDASTFTDHGFANTMTAAEYNGDTPESLKASAARWNEYADKVEKDGDTDRASQYREWAKGELENSDPSSHHFTEKIYNKAEVDSKNLENFDKEDASTWSLSSDKESEISNAQSDLENYKDDKSPENWSNFNDDVINAVGQKYDELSAKVADFDANDADTYPEEDKATAAKLIEDYSNSESEEEQESLDKQLEEHGSAVKAKLQNDWDEHEKASIPIVKDRIAQLKQSVVTTAKAQKDALKAAVKNNSAQAKDVNDKLKGELKDARDKAVTSQGALEEQYSAIQDKADSKYNELVEKDNGVRD